MVICTIYLNNEATILFAIFANHWIWVLTGKIYTLGVMSTITSYRHQASLWHENLTKLCRSFPENKFLLEIAF